jgi:cytochrome P450
MPTAISYAPVRIVGRVGYRADIEGEETAMGATGSGATSGMLIDLPEQPEMFSGYEERRSRGAVTWDEERRAWIVVGFDECAYVERNEEVFAHPERPDLVPDAEVYEMIQQVNGGPRALILLQGEAHQRLHRAISRSLAARMRECQEGELRPLVDSYIAELPERVEFIDAFADRLPTAVISMVMGLPWVGEEEVLAKARRCTAAIGEARVTLDRDSDAWTEGYAAAAELSEMLRPFVGASEGADDYIGQLWRMGREIFDDWGEDDVVAQCRTLFFAGSNSSTHFLTNIAYVLALDPRIWQELRQDDARVRPFVEEVLRVASPVQTRPRTCVRDSELGGAKIKAGDTLLLINGAGNRDPGHYACPHQVNVGGPVRPHLSFNVGPRTCVGAPTARMEGVEVVKALVAHFGSAHVDPQMPAPQFTGLWNSLYSPLHLVFERLDP